jgi:RNA polymerase sigma-70 factor (ECF subfamily)
MQREIDTAALVRRVQRGEIAAFEPLVRAFLRPAYAVALAVLARRADAEDVAQDALVVALERIESCRHPERFAGWLLQIVRHRALNRLDERRLRDVTADGAPPEPRVEPADAARVGLERRLVAALAELTMAQREVVLLHDLEDWTHAEIGAALGLSEGMSRQHLFQARRRLRARLAGAGRAEEDHERP